MTTSNFSKGASAADPMQEAVRATAEASRRTLQSTQDAARLSRDLFEQGVEAYRKMFAAYTASVTAGIKATFELQNAALSAGFTLLEAAGANERQIVTQFMDAAHQSQQATLEAWQAGVRAADKVTAGGTPA